VTAQLSAAKATQQSAKLAMNSEIGDANTTVPQIQAQLENASWELSQTTIRAPADGYVTAVAPTVGDRALQLHSAMSFIVEKEITLVGMFSQNSFQTIRVDTPVDIVFDNAPGRIYHAKITAIPKGVGQGQVAVSGTLARTNALGGATAFPAEISVPDEMSRDSLRLGTSGGATQHFRKSESYRPPRLDSGLDQRLYPPTSSQRRTRGKGAIARSLWHKLHIGDRGIEQPVALTVPARPSYAPATEFSRCLRSA